MNPPFCNTYKKFTLGASLMKRILCFGDSNTWGYIPGTGSLQRFPEGVRWTSLLQQRLGSTYNVIEFGLCGCESSGKHTNMFFNTDAQSLYSSVLVASSPVDVMIIMLGTNDLKTVNEWKQGDTAATSPPKATPHLRMGFVEC
jgi:lysophospholipase L1-like esterase